MRDRTTPVHFKVNENRILQKKKTNALKIISDLCTLAEDTIAEKILTFDTPQPNLNYDSN